MDKLPFSRIAVVYGCLFRKEMAYLIAVLLVTSPARAGEFAVSPIRLDFDQANKSGSITVTNDAATELKVQLRLFEWFQGPTGRDDYVNSEDLLYFPRLATISPHSQRVIRIGLRGAPVSQQEKSYRLFVEEIPEKSPSSGGARLAIAVRFGVPIFVRPAIEKARGVIERMEMEKGQLRVVVRNTGNAHFKISTINASSGELFSSEINGWYLLPGAAREYVLAVPPEKCVRINRIHVVVKTDRMQLERGLDTTKEMCGK